MHCDRDEHLMRIALNLAKCRIGTTSPNPTVGCVISKDNETIGRGWTHPNCGTHAEAMAIKSCAYCDISGSTMYVTLEPCCHYGNNPPCVDAIIRSGIKRVVVAVKDCDSRVNGNGMKILQDAGLDVAYGILKDEAIEINKGFFCGKRLARPHITAKIATTLDGKIASYSGNSKWITSEKSRRFTNLLRARYDGILIGSGTLKSDNPSLNCRIPGLEKFSPAKIVVGKSLKNIDFFQYEIFRKSDNKVIIITDSEIKDCPVHIECKNVGCEGHGLNVHDIAHEIYNSGINHLLIEGGGAIITSFLREDLIDEIIWIRASCIAGDDGLSAVRDMHFEKVTDFKKFDKHNAKNIGDDVVEYLKKR